MHQGVVRDKMRRACSTSRGGARAPSGRVCQAAVSMDAFSTEFEARGRAAEDMHVVASSVLDGLALAAVATHVFFC